MSDFEPDVQDHNEHEGQLPAAPTSGLARLRAEREKIKEELFLDLRVPRYEVPLFVRYSPVQQSTAKRVHDRAKKSNDSEASVIANAQLLAEHCVGVFEMDPQGDPIGDPEDWPKFDRTLAEYLGADTNRAADVVRLLFLTDGDIMATVQRLMEWSGFAGDQITEEYEGN